MRQPEESVYDYRSVRTNEDDEWTPTFEEYTGASTRKNKLRDRRARKGYRNGEQSDFG